LAFFERILWPTVPKLKQRIQAMKSRPDIPLCQYLADSVEASWICYRKRLKRYRQHKTTRRVHDLRIGIRRLSANLDAVELAFTEVHCRRIRSILGAQLKALGTLRDSHLQLDRLDRLSKRSDDFAALRHHLEMRIARRKRFFAKVRKGKSLSRRIQKIIKELRRAGTSASGNRAAWQRVQRGLRTGLHGVIQMQPRSTSHKRRLHRARIAVKKYCYFADLFAGYKLGINRKIIEILRDHQNIIGDLHDLQLFTKRFKAQLNKAGSSQKRIRRIYMSLRRQNDALASAYSQSVRRVRGRP